MLEIAVGFVEKCCLLFAERVSAAENEPLVIMKSVYWQCDGRSSADIQEMCSVGKMNDGGVCVSDGVSGVSSGCARLKTDAVLCVCLKHLLFVRRFQLCHAVWTGNGRACCRSQPSVLL